MGLLQKWKEQREEEWNRHIESMMWKSEAKEMLLALHAYGFAGEPMYYSDGGIQEGGYEWKIWKPIDKNHKLCLERVVGGFQDRKSVYIFRIAVNDHGWCIKNEERLRVAKDGLDELNQNLISELNSWKKRYEEQITNIDNLTSIINHEQPKVQQQ